ncbi:MAG: hypothetical protein HYV08_01300 [Deltaproteobacteria bacterium]|nr:hypothetical protein [Deltaproteobacteria bacterium]MBI3076867.1 hypothetical protein [Deltaproteobacteria bacterium]
MELELGSFIVREVALGETTRLQDGRLSIAPDEIRALVADSPELRGMTVDVAQPGESTRIAHILDGIEPRCKVSGPGSIFPGLLGPPVTVGSGRTHQLDGVAVLTTATIPGASDGLGVKEALVDMAGPAAPYSPFSRLRNVVLQFDLREGLSIIEATAAVRLAGLKVAAYLAGVTREYRPDRLERFVLPPASSALPRVAYLCQVMTEGDIHTTYLYGLNVEGMLPTLLHPNEFMDGALVAGDYHIAAMRVATYQFQNNSVVHELCRLHGRALDFRGVILARNMWWAPGAKQRSAEFSAKLARQIGAEGVVITMQNGGHAVSDLMLACQSCERAGLKTAIVLFEMADADGSDWSLVDVAPEADAMVSTGNMDAVITLPPVDRVLGGTTLLDFNQYEGGGDAHLGGAFTTALRRIYCATTPGGDGRLRARAA